MPPKEIERLATLEANYLTMNKTLERMEQKIDGFMAIIDKNRTEYYANFLTKEEFSEKIKASNEMVTVLKWGVWILILGLFYMLIHTVFPWFKLPNF